MLKMANKGIELAKNIVVENKKHFYLTSSFCVIENYSILGIKII